MLSWFFSFLGTILFIIMFACLMTFAWAGFLAAPWVPLWQKDVRRMLKLAKIQPGETIYDLGAGDGRIIIMAAQEFKAKAVGFELAFLPYFIGCIKILVKGLRGSVSLKYGDFFKQDFSQADVICIFLTPPAMKKLKLKLEKETKSGCRIVSYAFSLPGWPPKIIDKPDQKTTTIYLYQK